MSGPRRLAVPRRAAVTARRPVGGPVVAWLVLHWRTRHHRRNRTPGDRVARQHERRRRGPRVTEARQESRVIRREYVARVHEHPRRAPPAVAVAQPAVIERVVAVAGVERVAVEIEERIAEVGRPAEAESEAVPTVPSAITVAAIATAVIRPVAVRLGRDVADGVGHDVVVEVLVAGHAAHQVEQRGLGIAVRLIRSEHAIVPMIAAHEFVELERRLRRSHQHRAGAVALVHEERVAVATAAHFELVAPACEVVVARIEREQRPHPSVAVHPQHHHVRVLRGAHVHPHPVALHQRAGGVDPDLYRRVIHAHGGRRRRGQGQGNCEWQQHRTLLLPSYYDSPPRLFSTNLLNAYFLIILTLYRTFGFTSDRACRHQARTGSARTATGRTPLSRPELPPTRKSRPKPDLPRC